MLLDTYESIANDIHSIRHGAPGKIVFTFRGRNFTFAEPTDVILVGWVPAKAKKYIANLFGESLGSFPRPKGIVTEI